MWQIEERIKNKQRNVDEKMASLETVRLNEVESRKEIKKLRGDEAARRLKMEKQLRLVKNVRVLQKYDKMTEHITNLQE